MVGYDRIREALQNQAVLQPHLGHLVAYWLSLLSIQARTSPRHHDYERLAQCAAARLRAGQPILQWNEFPLYPLTFAILCHQVCIVTAKYFPHYASPLEAIRDWLCQEHQNLIADAKSYWDKGMVSQGEQAGLPRALLAFVFNQALHPTLRKYARLLGGYVDNSMWYRPFCPLCGGAPDFAALEKKTGERKLLCSRCDLEWSYWRLTCSFCGADEPEQLTYSATGTPGYLLCQCAACGKQLETLDQHQFQAERLLVVERNLRLAQNLFGQPLPDHTLHPFR